MMTDLGIAFGRVAFMMFFVLNVAALLGWVERKQSAIMQDRIGANRAAIFGVRALGLFHPLADTLKMLTKEDFRPARADRLLFELAPFVSVFFALVAFASIPFGDTLQVAGRSVPLQAVTLNVGILYVFAMLSLGVYGVMMAGWSSANNFALLGGQRAAALMISAEIAIGASIMGVIMIHGSLNLMEIVRGQGQLLWGWLPAWGILTQPLAFVLFVTAGIALPPLLVTLLQVGAFVGKVAVVIFVLMLIRWTLPRFRYDQAMRLGWLGLFPLAIANIVVTGMVLAAWGNG